MKTWARHSENCASQALLSLTETEAGIIAMTTERLANVDSETYTSRQVSEFGKWAFGAGFLLGTLLWVGLSYGLDWWVK